MAKRTACGMYLDTFDTCDIYTFQTYTDTLPETNISPRQKEAFPSKEVVFHYHQFLGAMLFVSGRLPVILEEHSP